MSSQGGHEMMTAETAKEVLAEMRRDGMSVKVEKKFLATAIKIGRLSDGAKAVYAARIEEIK